MLFSKKIFRAFPEYAACEVIQIPSKYDFKPYAYGFQKDSPYLHLFNHYLKEMREKGTLKKILNKYQAAPQVCPDSSGLPLGFESVFTAFLLLVGGIILGLILFCIECYSRMSGTHVPFLEIYDKSKKIDVFVTNNISTYNTSSTENSDSTSATFIIEEKKGNNNITESEEAELQNQKVP